MTLYSNLRQRLTVKLPAFVFIICLLQPILDVLSYWTYYFEISNSITLVLRLFILFAVFAFGFILSDRKNVYLTLLALLLILTAGHFMSCTSYNGGSNAAGYAGYNDLIGDMTNMLRIYHLPLMAIAFITFLKKDKKVYGAIVKGFIASFILIAAIELISVITGTNPYTYPNKELGVLGWFYFANTQSAIISVLAALFVYKTIERFKKNIIPMILLTSLSMGILWLFATRLTYISLAIIGIGSVITLLITKSFEGKTKPVIALSLVTATFLALFPLSPMYSNQKQFGENLAREQERIYELTEEYEKKALEKGLTGEELKVARLEGVYLEHLPGLVKKFGLEATVKHFNYTEDAEKLYNFREMKIAYNSLLIDEYGTAGKLFGTELSDLTAAGRIHDAENDFHGIYYLCGAFGLVLLIAFIGHFILMVLKALIFNFKKTFTLRNAAWAMALITLLLHVYATAGVLRRPNGSFYLSVVLAVIYYIVKTEAPLTRRFANNDERTEK